MKTIKELDNMEGDNEEMQQVIAYREALKDVLKLIDELAKQGNKEGRTIHIGELREKILGDKLSGSSGE